MVLASGICRSMFICLHVMCVLVCVSVVPATASLSPPHTPASLQDWASPLLMPPHQSQIQPQLLLPFPSMLSPPPGLDRVQQPPLPLYHCVVQAVRPCWYHTIPGRKIHAAWRMYVQVLFLCEGLLRIRKDYKLLKLQILKLVGTGGKVHFSANYRCKSHVLANEVTMI